MKGISHSTRYTAEEKRIISGIIGGKMTVEKVLEARNMSRTLSKDLLLCEDFSRYLAEMYHSSCRAVKNKITVKEPKPENQKISKFIAESFSMAKGNVRSMYYIAFIDKLVNNDADGLIESIVAFDPKKDKSLEWFQSLRIPTGSPAVAMFSNCVKDFGFRFPVDAEIDVTLNPKMTMSVVREHWILEKCPVGLGSVAMILAGSKFNKGTHGI